MLETIYAKTRAALLAQGKKNWHLRWPRILPPGVWVMALVFLLLGGRWLWLHAGRPAHVPEITAAFGSASVLYNPVQLNHAGSQFTYVATSDHGYGLFLCDVATGGKQITCAENGGGRFGATCDLHAWPWSPDDRTYIYAVHDQLVICPVENDKPAATLTVGTNTVTDLVWLNPGEFVYIRQGTNLCHALRQPDGQWEQSELTNPAVMTSLTAVGGDTVAWLQNNLVCRLDLAGDLTGTNNPFLASNQSAGAGPVFSPPTNGLVLWLDASTLKQPDQTSVAGLADLSPAKNDAVPNPAPPVFNASDGPGALNGRGTIHFASDNSGTNGTGLRTKNLLGITGAGPRTVFAVMHHDPRGVMRIGLGSYGARFGYFGLEQEERSIYMPRLSNRYSNRVILRAAAWNVCTVVFNGTNLSTYVDGLFRNTNSLPVKTVDNEVELGSRSADANGKGAAGADGDFAELLIYNQAVDDASRQQVENYLAGKWLGGGQLSPNSPLVWCDPQMAGLVGFSYSKENGQFLLIRRENGRDSLWQFDPKTGKSVSVAQAAAIQSAQWAGPGKFAYASLDPGSNSVVFVDTSDGSQTLLSKNESVSWFGFMPDGEKMLLLGIPGTEPSTEIWESDLASHQSRTVVSYTDHPSVYARNIIPIEVPVALPSGRTVTCTVYAPLNLDHHKKYPLVIGDTVFHTIINGSDGRLGMPAIAASGAYVVIINRASWDGGIERWGENVMGVCQSLMHDSQIDPGRIYLFGASAETYYMSSFVTNSPGLWKGVILLNPTGLPDFSGAPFWQHRPQILISAGGLEDEDDQIKRYQATALNSGAMVDVVISPGETHHFVGNAAQLERTRAMTHFIFEE